MADDSTDYRSLLWRYMAHVIAEEGISFVDRLRDGDFSDAEIAVLEAMDREPPPEWRERSTPATVADIFAEARRVLASPMPVPPPNVCVIRRDGQELARVPLVETAPGVYAYKLPALDLGDYDTEFVYDPDRPPLRVERGDPRTFEEKLNDAL